jgi:type I restriction enzyme S subunit
MAGGVGQMRVPATFLESVLIPVAPIAEQERIADALDELFSDLQTGVAALERVQEKLRLYRASVLKAAVEGTLTAQWRAANPHVEPASDLLKRILVDRRRNWEQNQIAQFRAKGKEPPKSWKEKYKAPAMPKIETLPPLPAGWCWSTIDQLGDIGTGATPNRGMKLRYYDGGTIPWVVSSCVNSPGVREPTEFVTPTALEECNLTLYPPGTLLIAMYGEGKTRGMWTELLIESTTNQALAAVQAHPDVKEFLKVFLRKNYQDLRRAASGGVQPNLNLRLIRDVALPLPPRAEQQIICESTQDKLSVIDHLESDIGVKLKGTQNLRQAILRQAYTGQLVTQDPNDEPASELLKRIVAEREARARETVAAIHASKTTKTKNAIRSSEHRRRKNKEEV